MHRAEAGPVHPTAARFQDRASALGIDIHVQELADSTRTAEDAARAVGCELGQIVKSVVLKAADGGPMLCLCAGDRRIDLGALGDGVVMARGREVREATGYAIGGVPPICHERPVATVVDSSLRRFSTVWCAAGTPNAVFEIEVAALLRAIPGAELRDVGA
ncbi:MAG TPA: YbaK/EbsC family protein [Gaiellales bacterium]|nr:YbaK/EbsC family protein [Gaiellales bacterium]